MRFKGEISIVLTTTNKHKDIALRSPNETVLESGEELLCNTLAHWNKNESILDAEFVFSSFVVFVENGILDTRVYMFQIINCFINELFDVLIWCIC